MRGDELQERARARAEELPGSGLEHPFGPEWEVYKVRGRVFMLMTALAGQEIVTLKADPYDALGLCGAYEEIIPGYHMNKRHWITVRPGEGIPDELIDDLVTESYLLVVERLPRAKRPVDPSTFGRS